jgi:ribosome-associated heat shock protein Hsp15
METNERPAIRLDQWLWAARWFKTRSLAKTAIEAGRVTLDGQAVKPSRPARVGDKLDILRAGERYEVEVLSVSDRRGSAAVAQALYRESDASRDARLAEREKRRLDAAGYQPPGTKPDKRARRLIRALGDLDAL